MTDSDKNEKPEGNLLPVQGARELIEDLIARLVKARDDFAGLPHSLGYEFTHLPEMDSAIRRANAWLAAPPPAADDGQAVAQGWLAECEPYPEADFDMRNCAEQLAALLAEKIV